MKRSIAIAVVTILLAPFLCSAALSQSSGEVYLAGFLLLRIRCAAGGCTLDQRVTTVQFRANDLLALGKGLPKFTVKKKGKDSVIYADKDVFLTVTPADGKATGMTAEKLAHSWAQRLRTILPQATPDIRS